MGLNKEDALKKINEAQEESEFEVFTGDEHKTYLDNYSKTEVEKRIGDEVSKIHKQYDDDVFEILGERKSGTEKTYNFIKRKLKELKESAGSTATLQEQIKKLEDDLKNKSGDEQLKKDFESLRKKYDEDKQSWDQKTQEYLRDQEAMKIEIRLDNAAARLKFNETIPASLRELAVQNAKQKLMEIGKIVDGELIFVDSEGATMRNKDNALNPFTADELLAKELKDVLGETKTITGTGVKPKFEKDKDGKETISVAIPDSVKTKEDLTKHLMSLGLNRNSKEYMAAYEKYSENLPQK